MTVPWYSVMQWMPFSDFVLHDPVVTLSDRRESKDLRINATANVP